MSVTLRYIEAPDPAAIGNNLLEFMNYLGGPSCIFLPGRDYKRTRALVTLLHGNEPSGSRAVFRWIKSQQQPAVNIICIIASVNTALTPPLLQQRMLATQRDLNRCFQGPFNDDQGQLAASILECLKHYQPEAVIDMHNTSGSGPAFSVVTHMDSNHDALASLFVKRMIVTGLRLGALMEISEDWFPTVTVECGGREDEEAHEIAWDGLCRYFLNTDVLLTEARDFGLELLRNPVRFELQPGVTVTYSDRAEPAYDLTLIDSIEHCNSGTTVADTPLGWVNCEQTSTLFRSTNSRDQCVLEALVYIRDGILYTKQDLKLSMVTNNAEIAKSDCVFYAVKSDGQEIIHD